MSDFQVILGGRPIGFTTSAKLDVDNFAEKPNPYKWSGGYELSCDISKIDSDKVAKILNGTPRYDVKVVKEYHLPRKAKKARRRPSPKNIKWQMLADRIIDKSFVIIKDCEIQCR